ncbi:hypothetical protein JCM16303_003819 [Sporobolomyces ruberrimus]
MNYPTPPLPSPTPSISLVSRCRLDSRDHTKEVKRTSPSALSFASTPSYFYTSAHSSISPSPSYSTPSIYHSPFQTSSVHSLEIPKPFSPSSSQSSSQSHAGGQTIWKAESPWDVDPDKLDDEEVEILGALLPVVATTSTFETKKGGGRSPYYSSHRLPDFSNSDNEEGGRAVHPYARSEFSLDTTSRKAQVSSVKSRPSFASLRSFVNRPLPPLPAQQQHEKPFMIRNDSSTIGSSGGMGEQHGLVERDAFGYELERGETAGVQGTREREDEESLKGFAYLPTSRAVFGSEEEKVGAKRGGEPDNPITGRAGDLGERDRWEILENRLGRLQERGDSEEDTDEFSSPFLLDRDPSRISVDSHPRRPLSSTSRPPTTFSRSSKLSSIGSHPRLPPPDIPLPRIPIHTAASHSRESSSSTSPTSSPQSLWSRGTFGSPSSLLERGERGFEEYSDPATSPEMGSSPPLYGSRQEY